MSDRFLRVLAILFALLLLNACSTLSEQECRTGDWPAIGYRDGQNGRPAARLDEHRKSCSAFGTKIDSQAYMSARERGLNFYCTPANALAVGRRGEQYASVCPEWAEAAFLRNYEAGHEVFAARQRIEALEREQYELERLIRAADNKVDVNYYTGQLMRLRMERDFAWAELRRREMRADMLRF